MTGFGPVRPALDSWPVLEAQPFDPRTSTFIPDLSVMDKHIAEVSPRKVRLIGAKCYDSTTQTIADDTATGKEFDSTEFDTDGMFNNTNDTLVIPYYGIWLVSAYCEFASNATGRRKLILQLNGADNIAFTANAVSGAASQLAASFPLLLDASDTLGFDVYQNSTGNLDTSAGVANNFLSAIYIGSV